MLVTDHGALVADSFGSVAGEMALTQSGVGMADRTDLSVLEVSGEVDAIGRAVERVAGIWPEVGMGWPAAGAWWCAVEPKRVLVIADDDSANRLAPSLHSLTPGSHRAEVREVSDDYSVITVVGPKAEQMLIGAGVPEGEQPSTASYVRYSIAGRETLILREAHSNFLMLSGSADAVTAWTELRDAGRPFDVGFVGHEALARLSAAERRYATRVSL